MRYKFETRALDLSDLASGAVFRSAPGRPAFPVRLASELFQRAHGFWAPGEPGKPCDLYDPCCGTGYSLSVLKLLHWSVIGRVTGSDVDEGALELARSNLDLLRPAGINARVRHLAEQVDRFGKESHVAALESARRLRAKIERLSAAAPLDAEIKRADALDPGALAALVGRRGGDIVFADVPYGSATAWHTEEAGSAATATRSFFASLAVATTPGSVVIVAERKTQPRIAPAGFVHLASLRGKGHRLTRILRRVDEATNGV